MLTVFNSADALVWTVDDDQQQAAILADPTVAQLNSAKPNRIVFLEQGPVGSHRLRLGALLPGGGRPAAATVGQSAPIVQGSRWRSDRARVAHLPG